MKQRAAKTRLTGGVMAWGLLGLSLFGSSATVFLFLFLIVATMQIQLLGPALILFPWAFAVWVIGGVIVGFPIWAGLHALGLRGWPVAVAGGAGLVGLIWLLAIPHWIAGGAGALAGAVAGHPGAGTADHQSRSAGGVRPDHRGGVAAGAFGRLSPAADPRQFPLSAMAGARAGLGRDRRGHERAVLDDPHP